MKELSDDTLSSITRRAKRQMRQRLSALRQALPALAVAERSARIVASIAETTLFRDARSLALYDPMAEKGEVDLRELDRAARKDHKIVYYPFVQPAREHNDWTTGFRRADDPATLEDRGHGFREPPLEAPSAQRGDLDLIVVPALAADIRGYRLGFGVGFYDATLPDVRPPACALLAVFDFQLVPELPVEPHDVACDLIVTDTRVIDLNSLLEA